MISYCKCGHIKDTHQWEYADDVVKLEGCKSCSCKRFDKSDCEELSKMTEFNLSENINDNLNEKICAKCGHTESCHKDIHGKPIRCVYGYCKCKSFKLAGEELSK